jgi:hypothetical protein
MLKAALAPAKSTVSKPVSPSQGTVSVLFSVGIVLAMILVLPSGPESGPYTALSTIFSSIVMEALPFM